MGISHIKDTLKNDIISLIKSIRILELEYGYHIEGYVKRTALLSYPLKVR